MEKNLSPFEVYKRFLKICLSVTTIQKTLFLSVQHPGERTTDLNNPTSKWPFDEDKIPKPSVVAITGDLIEKMNNLNILEKY